MPYENQEEKENLNQNIHNNDWQDEGSQNDSDSLDDENKEEESNENQEAIPQLTTEEKAALDNWRNSNEMKEGLEALLPTNDGESANVEDTDLPQLIQDIMDENMSDELKNAISKETGINLDGFAKFGSLGTLQPKDKAKIRALIDD